VRMSQMPSNNIPVLLVNLIVRLLSA
jgi:hypothetical protein